MRMPSSARPPSTASTTNVARTTAAPVSALTSAVPRASEALSSPPSAADTVM